MKWFLLSLSLGFIACTSELPEQPEASTPTQRTQAPARESALVDGIDVSHWQGRVDWPTVEKAGITFAFVKATQGTRSTDKRFKENWRALADTRIARGAYHFLEPDADGTLQAKHFLDTVQFKPGDLLPVVDVEKKGSKLLEVLSAFLAEVKTRLGVDAIIYVSPAFWNDELGSKLEQPWPNPLWIAEYGVKQPRPTTNLGPWTIWQFDEKGRVAGIEGNVDRDKARSLETMKIR